MEPITLNTFKKKRGGEGQQNSKKWAYEKEI